MARVWIGCAIGLGMIATSFASTTSGAAPFQVVATSFAMTEPSTTPPELADLRERWTQAMSELGVPGLAVIVVRGNQVIYRETLGYRDPENKLPVTPDTMFYIASCTKSFVAMALMSLVDEGKVSLNAPVKTFLPRFAIVDAGLTETLTIRDLLSHAKGINSDPIVTLDAYTGEITEDRYYRWLREATASGKFGYSNIHYTLAGRVIEAVTGRPWKDSLEERIFKPAGMTRTTGYASKMYGNADCAIPCIREDGKPVPAKVRKSDRVMHAAGGLGSSIDDLGRWLILNLNGGAIEGKRILSQAGVTQMQTTQSRGEVGGPPVPGRTREGYGLGWFAGAYKGKRVLDHGGGYIGTSAAIWFFPEARIGVAAVSNSDVPMSEVAVSDVSSRILGLNAQDFLPKVRQYAESLAAKQRSRNEKFGPNPAVGDGLSLPPTEYAGMYENPDWGTLRLEYKNNELTGQWGDLTLRLGSTGKDQFAADMGTGEPDPGRFEITNNKVVAVILKLSSEPLIEARFARP